MSAVLNVKINPIVKNKARKIADQLGLSLSGVVNAYLRQFIRSETLFVSSKFEEPSEFLLAAIQAAADDSKNQTAITFKSASHALAHLDSIIKKK